MELLTLLYEKLFVKDIRECPYLPSSIDSLGIMLKGKSLEQFSKYDKEFKDCFLVNNFDKEVDIIGDSLMDKNCIHFVNRLMTAPLTPEHYKKFNITEVQLPKISAFGDKRLTTAVNYYKSLGLNIHYLPKSLLEYNKKDFDKEYARKYPNTGILAIIYALVFLKPKKLWIVGLDFYQSDYLVRRPHQNPLHLQQEKMDRINLVEVTANIFRKFPEVDIKMVSYYKGFPELDNLEILT